MDPTGIRPIDERPVLASTGNSQRSKLEKVASGIAVAVFAAVRLPSAASATIANLNFTVSSCAICTSHSKELNVKKV